MSFTPPVKRYNQAFARLVASSFGYANAPAFDRWTLPPYERAARKIRSTGYDFSIPRKKVEGDGPRLFDAMSRFNALKELRLIDPRQYKGPDSNAVKLESLWLKLESSAKKIAGEYGVNLLEIKNEIFSILKNGEADSIEDAERLLLDGPRVIGFENSKDDPKIPDEAVNNFLREAFGKVLLISLQIRKIVKNELYYVFCFDPAGLARLVDLKLKGVRVATAMLLQGEEEYISVAQVLENDKDLKHIYRGLGKSGSCCDTDGINVDGFGFNSIYLYSFKGKRPTGHSFIENIKGLTEEDKMRVYILGALAHEIGHKYVLYARLILFYGIIANYLEETENEGDSKPYITDYIRRHKEIYESDKNTIAEEDFCEAIRIFLTDEEYLRKNFPARHSFIENHLGFLKGKGGLVVRTVRDLSRAS